MEVLRDSDFRPLAVLEVVSDQRIIPESRHARIMTNRARPDLTQTHRYTLINNKLTPW